MSKKFAFRMLNTEVLFKIDNGPQERINADLGYDRGQFVLPLGYEANVN